MHTYGTHSFDCPLISESFKPCTHGSCEPDVTYRAHISCVLCHMRMWFKSQHWSDEGKESSMGGRLPSYHRKESYRRDVLQQYNLADSSRYRT